MLVESSAFDLEINNNIEATNYQISDTPNSSSSYHKKVIINEDINDNYSSPCGNIEIHSEDAIPANSINNLIRHNGDNNDITDDDSIIFTHYAPKAISRSQLAHFLDLIYVAGIYNLNHLYDSCGHNNFEVIHLIIGIFLIIYITRHHFDIYSIMFYSNDMFHRIIFMILNLSVFIMVMNIDYTNNNSNEHRKLLNIYIIPQYYEIYSSSYTSSSSGNFLRRLSDDITDDSDDGFVIGTTGCVYNIQYALGFAVGYLFSRIVLTLMYGFVSYSAYILKQYDHMKTYLLKIFPLLFGTAIMCPIFTGTRSPLKVFIFITIAELFSEIIPELFLFCIHRKYFSWDKYFSWIDFQGTIRPHEEELADRLQEFFLIVSGEAIIGLLTFSSALGSPKELYVSMVFSFNIIFSFVSHFLVTVHRTTEGKHAMTKAYTIHRLIFIWLHPVICFSILITYNALTNINKYIGGKDKPTTELVDQSRLILSAGLGIVVLLMIIMRLMHHGLRRHTIKRSSIIHIVFKLFVAILHFLFYYAFTSNLRILIAHGLLASTTNILEMLFPYFQKEQDLIIFKMHESVHVDHKQSTKTHNTTTTSIHNLGSKSKKSKISNNNNSNHNNNSNNNINSNNKINSNMIDVIDIYLSKRSAVSELSMDYDDV